MLLVRNIWFVRYYLHRTWNTPVAICHLQNIISVKSKVLFNQWWIVTMQSKSRSKVQVKSPILKSELKTLKDLQWFYSAVPLWLKLKIKNSVQDCDKVESNSGTKMFLKSARNCDGVMWRIILVLSWWWQRGGEWLCWRGSECPPPSVLLVSVFNTLRPVTSDQSGEERVHL